MKFTKPRFWDLKRPTFIAYLLTPLTVFVRINNLLLSLKKKKKNKLNTICIGNIYVGGTGKTPSTIKLYKILRKLRMNVVVGKKFYKSQKDEVIILNSKTELIAGKSRKKIYQRAIKKSYDSIIFDDGLQDKNFCYDLQIVCFDAQKFVGNNLLIPAGPLREKIDSLKKYDCIFLKDNTTNKIKVTKFLKKINKNIKIFNTYLKIQNLYKFNKSNKYLIFSGIGNPDSFKKILLTNKINIIKEITFPDHYDYNNRDIKKIKDQAKHIGAQIITTEKDYVKISKIEQKNINFLKVDLIIKNEKKFISYLKSKINEKY